MMQQFIYNWLFGDLTGDKLVSLTGRLKISFRVSLLILRHVGTVTSSRRGVHSWSVWVRSYCTASYVVMLAGNGVKGGVE